MLESVKVYLGNFRSVSLTMAGGGGGGGGGGMQGCLLVCVASFAVLLPPSRGNDCWQMTIGVQTEFLFLHLTKTE